MIEHPLVWRVAMLSAALASCTVYNTPRVAPLAPPGTAGAVIVESPVKVHLLDGSTAVYPLGVIVTRDTVRSARATAHAVRYGLALEAVGLAGSILLDSVFGMESYQDAVNVPVSVIASTLAVGATALGVAATVVAINCLKNPKCFGSCPTFYSDSAGTAVLEAEGFSYSIAPLFEARDVDRLRAHADSAGDLRIEVRNEAFETHYINHLGLLEVRHGIDELVLPGSRDEALATSGFASPLAARDRARRLGTPRRRPSHASHHTNVLDAHGCGLCELPGSQRHQRTQASRLARST